MATPVTNNNVMVNIVGPALRMLAARSGAAAVVKFSETVPASGAAQFKTDKTDTPSIVAGLRKLAERGSFPPAVAVPRIGAFTISNPTPPSGRAGGLVAIVTGGAQGFGLEIAQDLACEGANVVIGDINADGIRTAVDAINSKCGGDRAVGLTMNVTDATSVSAAIDEVVRRFGGFDVLISNAGVLRAGSVRDQTEKDFDIVTAVNYKGFFLCVKHAAPVLAVQHMAMPGYYSDIIQINSKSGLEGSMRNAAYAGSKFGGIGLTQSYALELIEDGIKVNAICPGNFFDGPLWSDPKTGLFVQYLKSGKVPDAKTVADVRKAYEAKVPMGRGCTTPDVLKAIYYVIEQKYETGQAIPVTGGQVMLK